MKEMYFVECKKVDFRVKTVGSKGCRYKLLKQFADSGIAYAEIKNFTHKDANSCRASLGEFMYRLRKKGNHEFDNIRVHSYQGKVYLVNTLYGEDV